MDREERQKVYTLLSKFYPKAKQLADKETLTAWGMVLERYDYEAVKASVLDYAAKSRFFPNLSDLTAGLTPAAAPEQGEEKPRGAHPRMKRYVTPEYEARFPDSGVSRYAREHGITWEEARQAMMQKEETE